MGSAGTWGGIKCRDAPSSRMAAVGKIKSPIFKDRCKPPHIPSNRTAFGSMIAKSSIMSAAVGEPIEKSTIETPADELWTTPMAEPWVRLSPHKV